MTPEQNPYRTHRGMLIFLAVFIVVAIVLHTIGLPDYIDGTIEAQWIRDGAYGGILGLFSALIANLIFKIWK